MRIGSLASPVAALVAGLGLGIGLLPAGPPQAPAGPRALVERGRELFVERGCYGCHTIGALGTPIAPDLSRTGRRYDEAYLRRWIRDPALQRPTAHMPRLDLAEADVEALAAFLASLE